jgi:hypothetical protein
MFVRRAHVLVFKGKAEISRSTNAAPSATDTFARPHVIRLVQYIRVPRAAQRRSPGGLYSPGTSGAASIAGRAGGD